MVLSTAAEEGSNPRKPQAQEQSLFDGPLLGHDCHASEQGRAVGHAGGGAVVFSRTDLLAEHNDNTSQYDVHNYDWHSGLPITISVATKAPPSIPILCMSGLRGDDVVLNV